MKPANCPAALWELANADAVLEYASGAETLRHGDPRHAPQPTGSRILVRTNPTVAEGPHGIDEVFPVTRWFARYLHEDTVLVCGFGKGRDVYTRWSCCWPFRREGRGWLWVGPLDPFYQDIEDAYEAYMTMAAL